MARKRKKKRRNKNPTPKLTSMSDVVAKAKTSRKLIRLWEDAILKDEVIYLKQRLEKAHGERDSLRKRAAEREDQQEAVFKTLKEKVIVAQEEIQTLISKTRENDKQRRREHDDTQTMFEAQTNKVKLQRVTIASLQAELQDKDKIIGRFAAEVQSAVIKTSDLLEGQGRLKHVEKTLGTLRRKLVILGRAEASEEFQLAVTNHGRQREYETFGPDTLASAGRVPSAGPPGLGLVPLLIEGMAQFPDDVKVARDSLALLGYIASVEPLGRTFLTTHRLYHEIVAALQRHVADEMVALHAARLLHKSALQGEATALDLRAVGIIPLLAEALAAASYDPSGARKPRRLLYHAFETIRVCYPRGFFNESLQALGLSRRRNSGPNGPHDPTVARTDHPSTVGLGSCSRSTKTTTLTPATATATAASGGVLSSQNGTTINRNYGTGGGGTGGVHFLGAGAIREGVERSGMLVRSKPRLLGPRSRSPPLLRRRGRGVGTPTSAPRLDPMPCAARGRPCPGCDSQDHLSPSRHPIIRPQLSSLRQASSGTVRYPPEEGERNSYWDILGKYRNGTCHGDVRAVVENSEMAESAVASVVLLRWAMEYLKEQERNSSPGGGCRARSFNGKGEAPHSPMENSRSPSVKPMAMNATVSGPVHLMHAARKSKDSDLFLLPHSLESGNERSEDGSTSPRERVNIGFAATNPASLALSSAEKGGGRESDCDPSVSVVSGTFPSLENEPKNTESDLKRWLVPAAQDVALHALVCLLRAAEVDIYGQNRSHILRDINNGVGGGRAVATVRGVLLLVLRACAMFQDQSEVVKACCMLMRIGAQCSSHGGGSKRLVGGPIAPEMVLLVDHDVEGVVTRAAKAHVNNLPVTTEASALLHALGMDSISMKMSTPSGLLQPPSSPSVDSKMKSTVQPIVSIDTVTKTTTLNLEIAPPRV